MFYCEFCEVVKNSYFTKHLWATVLIYLKKTGLTVFQIVLP